MYADQCQQIGSRSMNRLRKLHLLRSQILIRILRKHPRQNQQIVEERSRNSWLIFARNSLLYFSQSQLLCLFFRERLLGLFHFLILGFDLVFCSASS